MKPLPFFPLTSNLFTGIRIVSNIDLMKRYHKRNGRFIGAVLFVTIFAVNAVAQSTLAKDKEPVDTSDNRWWYAMIFVALVGLGSAYYFWRKSKRGLEQPQYNYGNRYQDYYTSQTYEMADVDTDKELEWLRKAKKSP